LGDYLALVWDGAELRERKALVWTAGASGRAWLSALLRIRGLPACR
jgi:hypothetical protein